jgi:hypothetical protein
VAGRKTSVYLTEELAERVRESGLSLPDLIRRGLDAGGPTPLEEMIRRAVREEMAAGRRQGSGCPHPSDRVDELGKCRDCGEDVW